MVFALCEPFLGWLQSILVYRQYSKTSSVTCVQKYKLNSWMYFYVHK